jgi:putative PIN family toxin of toxin-antitoxin system
MSEPRPVGAVVDTNVWVSAVLNPSGAPAAVRHALVDQRFILVTSEPLLAELTDVLARPRIVARYSVSTTDAAELTALLRERAEVIAISGDVRLCRDPDDDAVIETARNGRADVLVTRDDDLKADWDLVEFLAADGVRVMSVRHFLEALVA